MTGRNKSDNPPLCNSPTAVDEYPKSMDHCKDNNEDTQVSTLSMNSTDKEDNTHTASVSRSSPSSQLPNLEGSSSSEASSSPLILGNQNVVEVPEEPLFRLPERTKNCSSSNKKKKKQQLADMASEPAGEPSGDKAPKDNTNKGGGKSPPKQDQQTPEAEEPLFQLPERTMNHSKTKKKKQQLADVEPEQQSGKRKEDSGGKNTTNKGKQQEQQGSKNKPGDFQMEEVPKTPTDKQKKIKKKDSSSGEKSSPEKPKRKKSISPVRHDNAEKEQQPKGEGENNPMDSSEERRRQRGSRHRRSTLQQEQSASEPTAEEAKKPKRKSKVQPVNSNGESSPKTKATTATPVKKKDNDSIRKRTSVLRKSSESSAAAEADVRKPKQGADSPTAKKRTSVHRKSSESSADGRKPKQSESTVDSPTSKKRNSVHRKSSESSAAEVNRGKPKQSETAAAGKLDFGTPETRRNNRKSIRNDGGAAQQLPKRHNSLSSSGVGGQQEKPKAQLPRRQSSLSSSTPGKPKAQLPRRQSSINGISATGVLPRRQSSINPTREKPKRRSSSSLRGIARSFSNSGQGLGLAAFFGQQPRASAQSQGARSVGSQGSAKRRSSALMPNINIAAVVVDTEMNIFCDRMVSSDHILAKIEEAKDNPEIVRLELEDLLERCTPEIAVAIKELLEYDDRPWEKVSFINEVHVDEYSSYRRWLQRKNHFFRQLGKVCTLKVIPVSCTTKLTIEDCKVDDDEGGDEGDEGDAPKKPDDWLCEILRQAQKDSSATKLRLSTGHSTPALIEALTNLFQCDDRKWESVELKLSGQAPFPVKSPEHMSWCKAMQARGQEMQQVAKERGIQLG